MQIFVVPKASPETLSELATYLEPFAPLFRRSTSRESVERYRTGLLTDLPRKNCDTIAAAVARTSPERLQHLLTDATWDPQALLSTNLAHTPEQMLTWFIRRWTMEVTFEEARTHLGMETQRQWNDRAIARTTPALLSLYSIITLTAQQLSEKGATCVRSAAWYRKTRPTFADALAWVRRHVWDHRHFSMSQQETDMIQIPRALFERFIDAVCYAA